MALHPLPPPVEALPETKPPVEVLPRMFRPGTESILPDCLTRSDGAQRGGEALAAPLRLDPMPLLARSVKPAFDPACMPDLRAPGAPLGGMIGGFAGPLPRHREAPFPPPFPGDRRPGYPWPKTTAGKASLAGGLILAGLAGWSGFGLLVPAAQALIGAFLP